MKHTFKINFKMRKIYWLMLKVNSVPQISKTEGSGTDIIQSETQGENG